MAESLPSVVTPFHRPVMPTEVINFFKPLRGGIFLDATVGGGGHAEAIITELNPARLIGIDRDPEAVAAAHGRLGHRAEIFFEKFSNLGSRLAALGIEKVSGILFDIGVSLHQLTTARRGFSYTVAGPLDMRMAPSDRRRASDVIKRLSERELVEIFSKYGEEHYAQRIARSIRKQRASIDRTTDLAEAIKQSVPRARNIKSLARVFQALRIYVNDELAELTLGLEAGIGALAPAGRIVVLAYHSLEDRIVKITFRNFSSGGKLRILTKKPLRPSAAEISSNPQARSCRLRAAEKAA